MANGMKYPKEWENINFCLDRLKVPGGWIVCHYTTIIVGNKDVKATESMIFLNDNDHAWSLE